MKVPKRRTYFMSVLHSIFFFSVEIFIRFSVLSVRSISSPFLSIHFFCCYSQFFGDWFCGKHKIYVRFSMTFSIDLSKLMIFFHFSVMYRRHRFTWHKYRWTERWSRRCRLPRYSNIIILHFVQHYHYRIGMSCCDLWNLCIFCFLCAIFVGAPGRSGLPGLAGFAGLQGEVGVKGEQGWQGRIVRGSKGMWWIILSNRFCVTCGRFIASLEVCTTISNCYKAYAKKNNNTIERILTQTGQDCQKKNIAMR